LNEGYVYEWLLIDWAVFLVLALLIDYLFGGVHGDNRIRRWLAMLYALDSHAVDAYIPFRSKEKETDEEMTDMSEKDNDVLQEEQFVKKGNTTDNTVIELQNLRKVYKKYKYFFYHDKKGDFTAVQGLWIHVEGGQLFCLLGHNGAGDEIPLKFPWY
jgi:ATPase subunit of ABC transporter with duplicated ATPase domains